MNGEGEGFFLGLFIIVIILCIVMGSNCSRKTWTTQAIERNYMVPVINRETLELKYVWKCDLNPTSGTLVIEK